MNKPNEATVLATIRARAESGGARSVRLRARLSLSEVARQCDTDPSTVSKWETGNRRPRGDAGLKYAALIEQLASLDLGEEVKSK